MNCNCLPKKHDYHKAIFILVAVCAALTLAPGLFMGIGSDPDGWREYSAGQSLFSTGVYHPSRTPGDPLFEYIVGFLSLFGSPIVSNLFVIITYIVSVIAFWSIAKGTKCRYLITVLYALTPVILINSNSTVDYIPALSFLLCSYACLKMGILNLSAIFLALSIGVRITGVLFLAPASLYLYLNKFSIRRIIVYIFIALSIGFLFYVPILIHDGLRMFKMPISPFDARMYFVTTVYRSMMLFGPIATVILLICVIKNIFNLKISFIDAIRRTTPEAMVEVVTIALFSILFIRHSLKTRYLLPIIPFIYLNITRWFSNKDLIVVSMAIISFGIVTVDLKGGQSGGRQLAFRAAHGLIYEDIKLREQIERVRTHIADPRINPKSVVLSGMGEMLTYHNPNLIKADWREISAEIDPHGIEEGDNVYRIDNGVKDTYLVYAMSKQNIQILLKEGYSIYYFGDAPAICVHYLGYHPKEFGTKLDISG